MNKTKATKATKTKKPKTKIIAFRISMLHYSIIKEIAKERTGKTLKETGLKSSVSSVARDILINGMNVRLKGL